MGLNAVVHGTMTHALFEQEWAVLLGPDAQWGVFPVTRWDYKNKQPGELIGWQVAEIRRVGRWNNKTSSQPVSRQDPSVEQSKMATSAIPVELCTIRFPFYEETKAYVNVMIDGVVRSFGKTTIVDKQMDGDMILLTLPRKVVAKRGFEKAIVG